MGQLGSTETGRLSICAMAVLATVFAASAPWAQAKPNVLVLMVDDMDTAMLESGFAHGRLPHIRREFFDRGTRFLQAFVTNPVCCPSRSTYLSGQYSHNHGVYGVEEPHGGFSAFDDASTLATAMQSLGYRTGHVGKYLNGYNNGAYVAPGWDTWNALVDGSTYCMYDYRISMNGSVRAYGSAPEEYQTDVLAGLADEFLRIRDPRPFFLTVTPLAPHEEVCLGRPPDHPYGQVRPAPRHVGTVDVPLPSLGSPLSFNEDDLQDKPAWMRESFDKKQEALASFFNDKLASMRAVDDMVARLASTLRQMGADRNTVLVFTSDNGFLYGSHRLNGKAVLYEESIRVPLAIRGPGQVQRRASRKWAANNDWAPTVLAYAGALGDAAIDGRSLVPLVKGLAAPGRQSLLFEHPPQGEALATGWARPYAMVRTRDPSITNDPSGSRILVYGETYDPVTGALTDREFYDLVDDVQQVDSKHASTDPARQQQMAQAKMKLDELKACAGIACRRAEDGASATRRLPPASSARKPVRR